MMAGSSVKSLTIGPPLKEVASVNTTPHKRAVFSPDDMIFLIGSVRRCPQYCAHSTDTPPPAPMTSSIKRTWI